MSADDPSEETLESIRILLELRRQARDDIRGGNTAAFRRYLAIGRLIDEYEQAWFRQMLEHVTG